VSQPGWTDVNTHDPGISVLELLAWLALGLLLGRLVAAWRSRASLSKSRTRFTIQT
jgi:hypothetical protein